ncbi:MAG: sensor histidine kinase [Limisphaerales bacterium]
MWQERRFRRQRERARQEYNDASFQQQQKVIGQAQAQQQALFNSMIEGVLLLDRDWRIQLINQSLRELFDVAGEISGQTILEAFRLPDLSELAARLKKEKTIFDVELEVRGKKKRCLQVNASAVVDRDGLEQGSIFVFHDLTRLKELENTRQEFVANVSHELRTPLSLIKGFAETLLDGAKDNPEVATRFLQNIDKHTDRLLFLIEDLLTISRLESGQIALNCHPVELNFLVERVTEDLNSLAREKEIILDNQIPKDFIAVADADRLQQVFFNLVENSIKYGKAKGRVTIGGRQIADHKIELFVEDDGMGIPPEARERIFERFYRADRARSRETGGTGLGLAIVKHIVQAHGSKVSVTSESNEGTKFFFTVPAKI